MSVKYLFPKRFKIIHLSLVRSLTGDFYFILDIFIEMGMICLMNTTFQEILNNLAGKTIERVCADVTETGAKEIIFFLTNGEEVKIYSYVTFHGNEEWPAEAEIQVDTGIAPKKINEVEELMKLFKEHKANTKKCNDDSCDGSHCCECGSHMLGWNLEYGATCDSCKRFKDEIFEANVKGSR